MVKHRGRIKGAIAVLAITATLFVAPKVTKTGIQEAGVMAHVYGVGWKTAIAIDVLGGAVCTVASGGLGIGFCCAGAAI